LPAAERGLVAQATAVPTSLVVRGSTVPSQGIFGTGSRRASAAVLG
jgi:hypothetical protein